MAKKAARRRSSPSTHADPAKVSIEDILRGTTHALTIFSREAIEGLSIYKKAGKPTLKCCVTERERRATPEEIVRQLFLEMLMEDYGYPADRIAIEKPVQMGSGVHDKPADIVIWDKDNPTAAYIIIECKKPKRADGLEQLKSYCNAEGSPIGVWTNGGETIHLHRRDPNYYQNLPDIPSASQTLSELLDEKWTIEDLEKHNVLVKEQTTLKKIVLDMENLVLANAGVDAFEEVFKLIYTKLYDESQAAQAGRRAKHLQFRVGGSTPTEFKTKLNDLFDKAKTKWPGVFLASEQIDLTPEHLVTCGSYLESVKLFNSNLQVIDEAFEYLAIQVGKGKKGQYFTPRHVIDMAVKMLNPNEDEFIIDTAAGSCGFTVHGLFHVWGNTFKAKGPEPWQVEYAREKVYAIDFDPRSVKIAKALNLIAGDGRTNVFCANALDPRSWSEDVKVGMRDRLLRFADRAKDKANQEQFRYFDFDLVLTNPPFAGNIKDSRIIQQYDIARKSNGKWLPKVGRDLLFIQRNLDFLKPGGRMAIVLPEGRLNNVSNADLRSFMASQARVLGVVSLHLNTFKPHTNTKTSILLLQKWNEDKSAGVLNKKLKDYPVFMAISRNGGKSSNGSYLYETEGGRYKLDAHGHPIVRHDLTEIADKFADFAKAEGLSFHDK
jgi:type I restriction enzyme M protein